jgi:methionine aminopeptidase
VVAQQDADAPISGRVADLLTAANTALEAAIRLFRPGKRISEVGARMAALSLRIPISGCPTPCPSHVTLHQ